MNTFRFVEVPGVGGAAALIDPTEVRAIEPAPPSSYAKSVIHLTGTTALCNLSATDAAKKLGISEGKPEPSGDAEKALHLLLQRAEAVLDCWKVGGEKLYEAIMDLDHEVAAQKASAIL